MNSYISRNIIVENEKIKKKAEAIAPIPEGKVFDPSEYTSPLTEENRSEDQCPCFELFYGLFKISNASNNNLLAPRLYGKKRYAILMVVL